MEENTTDSNVNEENLSIVHADAVPFDISTEKQERFLTLLQNEEHREVFLASMKLMS